jgi:hypothetical protein
MSFGRVAILDPRVQSPGLTDLFDASLDYFVMPYNDVNDNNVMPDSFFEKYSFLYREDIDSITAEDYDTLCIVYPPNLMVNPADTHSEHFREACAYHKEFIDSILSTQSFKQVLWFDNDDITDDPTVIYPSSHVTKWFKRNYCSLVTYSPKVVPFPFFMFGLTCPLWRILHMPYRNPEKIDRVYWSGGSHGSLEKSYATRESILQYMKPHIQQFFVFPADAYVKEVAKSKFSLDMNGNGDPNIRTFEILSTDSLLIQQAKYLVWGFDEGEGFSEETVYKTPEECLEKIERLRADPSLYQKCIDNQLYITRKYFGRQWLALYIQRNL